jgi:hypothetical protein
MLVNFRDMNRFPFLGKINNSLNLNAYKAIVIYSTDAVNQVDNDRVR